MQIHDHEPLPEPLLFAVEYDPPEALRAPFKARSDGYSR
jgi:hypothetical protein